MKSPRSTECVIALTPEPVRKRSEKMNSGMSLIFYHLQVEVSQTLPSMHLANQFLLRNSRYNTIKAISQLFPTFLSNLQDTCISLWRKREKIEIHDDQDVTKSEQN